MSKKIFIFGKNPLGKLLKYYIEGEGNKVEGYVLNKEYASDINGVYAIEDVMEKYGSANISIYVSVAYSEMNRIREKVFTFLRGKNIEILTYIHPSCNIAENVVMGEGNIFLENITIQPFSKIGDGNVLWNNVLIGHDSVIGSFNHISASVIMGGRIIIGNRNFIGINSTLKNDVKIDNEVFIGASTYVSSALHDGDVYVSNTGKLVKGLKSIDLLQSLEI